MCYSLLMENSLEKLAREFEAQPNTEAFAHYGALIERDPQHYKDLNAHSRIYPFYFAPIIRAQRERRAIVPMRYRVRPHDSREEPPSKYNLYNARLDTLTQRKTWQSLFMRHHGILVFSAFFEWVTGEDGKKCVVQFTPADGRRLIAPVLYDYWSSADPKEAYFSFAVITTDPPDEVREVGHDRCPIILKSDDVEGWLHPTPNNGAAIAKILHAPPPVKFLSGQVATFQK